MAASHRNGFRSRLRIAALAGIVAFTPAFGADTAQQTFASPQQAVEALAAGVRADAPDRLLHIFGEQGDKLVRSGRSDRRQGGAGEVRQRVRQGAQDRDGVQRQGGAGHRQARLAVSHPHRKRGRRVALRYGGRGGGDPRSAHRPQRTRCHPGMPGLRGCPARIRLAGPQRRRTAGIRVALSQQPGQARRPVLARGGERAGRVPWAR